MVSLTERGHHVIGVIPKRGVVRVGAATVTHGQDKREHHCAGRVACHQLHFSQICVVMARMMSDVGVPWVVAGPSL
jgi:hypothetical protein